MSISIGGGGVGMGPRHIIENFGKPADDQPINWRVSLRLLAYLRPYRVRMFAALVLMLAGSALTLAAPYLIKVAIDQHIAQGNRTGLEQTALLLVAVFSGAYAASAGQRYLLSWVGQQMLAVIRAQLFRHLQALHLGYHDKHIIGVTISRVINDVAVINDLLSEGLLTLVSDGALLIGIIALMLTMNAKLALFAFAVLPVMVVATQLFARRAQIAFRDTRARIAAVVGDLAEDISGMRVIQAFAQEGASRERFDKVNQANRDANISAMSLSFVFLPTIEFLGVLATAIVLWFGGRAVIGDEVTLGVMVAFLAYVSRFFQPIRELSQLYTTIQSAMAGGERVLALLDTPSEVVDATDAVEMPPIRGRIELRDVSFSYREDTEVLHDVNLAIEPGQTVALVGPTGAGKTSIANLIARLYEVTSGAILVDGVDVRKVTQHSLREQMGLVPQEPFLFAGTISENVRFGQPDATDSAIQEAARLANAHEFIGALPDGYATSVLEGGVNLSIGQRQLVCIARAILADPRILILDEATSSVDTITEIMIQQALHRLLAGRTAIVIAHRLSTIRNADLICVIDEGRIIERGTHEELIARDGLYHRLHDAQFAVPTQQ